MSSKMRIIFYGLIGLGGVFCCWPLIETMIYFQGSFPSLLAYSLSIGALAGLFLGGIYGMAEGLIQQAKKKLIFGLISGLIIGAIGGAVGILAGQTLALFLGTSINEIVVSLEDMRYPLIKALGWSIFGIFIGSVEGIRSRSFAKIRNGFLGGLLGGFLGGLAFETAIRLPFLNLVLAILICLLLVIFSLSFLIYSLKNRLTLITIVSIILFILAGFIIVSILPGINLGSQASLALNRLYGLLLLGCLIGIFYGLIEKQTAQAILLALNGPEKGKELIITQNITKIGEADEATFTIPGYSEIEAEHATLRKKRNEIILENKSSSGKTFVNDKKITQTVVKNGDVIRVGDAQFLFQRKTKS